MGARAARSLVFGVLGFSLLAGMAPAAPFSNGDFETPALSSPGAGQLLDNSSFAAPWVATSNQTDYRQVHLYRQTYYGSVASQGSQAVLFNSDGAATVTLSQTFDTILGQTYAVSFDLAREVGATATYPLLTLTATGNPAATYMGYWEANQAPFAPQGYKFTATGASTTLTFSQSTGPGSSPTVDNVVITPATPAALINGSFESPAIPTAGRSGNTYHQVHLGPNGYIPGWVTTSSNFSQGLWYTTNFLMDTGFNDSGLYKASDGNQYIMFNGDGQSTTTLAQTFATVTGADYLVTFDLARQPGAGTPATINLQATGGPLGLFTATQPVTVGYLLQNYNFTATGPLTTLTFTQSSGPDSVSPVVDNVTVTQLTMLQAIPEPASVTLLLLGIGGIWARRARKPDRR